MLIKKSEFFNHDFFPSHDLPWSSLQLISRFDGLHLGAIQRKEEKIAAMDDDVLQDLAADELAKQVKEEQKAAKKIRKEQEKVKQRIVANKKAARKGGPSSTEEEEEEEDMEEHDLRTFASSSKIKKK
jgi:hypothetical protein